MKDRIKKIFSLDENGLTKVLFNIVCVGGIISGIPAMIVSYLINIDMSQIVAIAVSIVILMASFYVANYRNRVDIGASAMVVVVSLVLFPLMFYTGGGIYGGMGYWFVLGILFNFLMLEGKKNFIILILQILITIGCFADTYLHPYMITPLDSEFAVYVDTVQSILIVSIVIGIIVRFQKKVYNDKMKELEEARADAQRAAEAAREAERVKADFLARMSHEIRTPINAVLGMDEMILRESAEENTLSYAKDISFAGKNLLSIINDVLDFSKIESGKLEIVPVEYDTAGLIRNIYNSFKERAAAKGLELVIRADGSIPRRLCGDDVRLTQILTNLMSNSVKYTEKGSVSLDIRDEERGDGWVKLFISVRDTGIGIKKEDIDKLYVPFERLEKERNRNIEGTGLGMAIVMNLISLFDSELKVESTYGEGSSFSFSISQKIADAEAMGDFMKSTPRIREREEGDQFTAPDAKLLVVDDNSMNLKVIKALLKKNKIVPVLASSGEECLQILAKEKFDLIFLDYMMPVMDGIETLTKAKESGLIPGTTPVVALTADAVMGARERYMEAGFDDYLSKPVEVPQLEEILKKYL
ncbi:MAG: response regulator [Lachnospiraceae bacterium]|nr:response regulator [Lachnospiraceae bacterium]